MNSETPTFKDHFSTQSAQYNQFRPQYPAELFAYLSSLSPQHQRAWDCATGTGQCALGLADFYADIIATDASKNQIRNATGKSNIHYRVASAENSGLESSTIDLITVAQALHWFDLDAFSQEAQRALKPGGILAVWTYNLLHVQAEIDKTINHLYTHTLENYWPAERKRVENRYQDIRLPLLALDTPDFKMTSQWNLHQLLGYLSTWSAVKKFESATGKNPLDDLLQELANCWGNPATQRTIT